MKRLVMVIVGKSLLQSFKYMKKIIIATLITIVLIFLAIILIRQITKIETIPETIITPTPEYQKMAETNYLASLPAETIALEFMDEAEAIALGIISEKSINKKIQVLQRDETGRVTQYRLIYSDKDIITRRMVR